MRRPTSGVQSPKYRVQGRTRQPVTAHPVVGRRSSAVLLVGCLLALGLGIAGWVSAASPLLGGTGVPSGGYVTTLFLEPISYESTDSYYDRNNVLQSVDYIFHHGVDISGGCVAGVNPVYAAADGTVALAQYINDGYGSQVAIDHGYNLGGNGHYTYTFYGHMGNRNTGQSYIMVSPGQYVHAGDLIGYQGNDGSAYGSCSPDPGTHVDWEIRASDVPLFYDTSMRYNGTAASPDFYTYQELEYDDPEPEGYVYPGPFDPGGSPTDTPAPEATFTPGPCGMDFSDLPDTDWSYQYVAFLFCRGAISGYDDGTFRPGNSATRAQFTKMLALGFGWNLYDPYWPSFSDVPASDPFYQYIETAHLRGVIDGYTDGTFRPGNPVTRAQVAKMVVLAHGWSPDYPPNPTFWDVQPSHWAYGYVEAASQHGIIGGYNDDTFRPNLLVTRAQLSKMLALALQQ